MSWGAKCVGMSVSVVTASVLLVGCTGGEPQPQQTFATYTPTGVPTPSPSASINLSTEKHDAISTAPARPPAMEKPDAAGAVEAAQYFLRLHLYVLATGDLVEWDRVAWSECRACGNIRDEVTRVYSSGGRFAPGSIDFSRAEAGPPDPALGWYPVEVEFALTTGAEFDANGQEVAAGLQESGVLTVDVVPTTTGWTLLEFSRSGA